MPFFAGGQFGGSIAEAMGFGTATSSLQNAFAF